MRIAAEKQEFEQALLLREQIAALKKVSERQVITELKDQDVDIIALEQDLNQYCVVLLIVRGGQILGEKHFFLKVPVDEEVEEILNSFIKRYYFEEDFTPRALIVSHLPVDQVLLEDWLSGLKGVQVKINRPVRGRNRQLISMAVHNARTFLEQAASTEAATDIKPVLEKLQAKLGLKKYPQLIVGIDISNTGGRQAVGSLVAFDGGRKNSKLYRRFQIKSVSGIDDYAMIAEVVSRYLKRVAKGEERLADLMLIDGGRGQLSAANSALQDSGFDGIDIVSLAKREEEIFLRDRQTPIRADVTSPECQLLMNVRDEAHRFAVSYHRKKRSKAMRRSALDQIPGIGAARRIALLQHFGSLAKIKEAEIIEIAQVKGIGEKRAAQVKEELKKR